MANIGVGLELSFSRLKLVTLEHRKEGVTIVNFDSENVVKGGTPEESLQNVSFAVDSILKRNRIKGKLGVSFPSHAIFTRQTKMLPQPDAQLYNTISFEINEYLPFPVNEAVWNYHKVNRQYNPGEEYDIIVIAAKYETMEQVEQILGNLIYKADILQFAPMALYTYLRYEFADKKETFLVLDIGETNNDMIVVEEGKFWYRSLALSGKDVTKAIINKLGVTEEEAKELKRGEPTPELLQAVSPFIKNLAVEINRSINFYKYTSKKAVVSEIKLCGSTSKIKNFAKLLQENSLIRTSLMEPPQTMLIHPAIEQTITEELPSLYPAIGLAIQAANLGEISFNFLPNYVIEYKKFSKKKPVALIGAVLLIIAVILSYLSLSKKNKILEQTLQNMNQIITENSKWLKDYNTNKSEINKLQLVDYIAQNIYRKQDKIIYLLDAIVYLIKLYNTSSSQQDKIYFVGFDYTVELTDKSKEKKQPEKGEKDKEGQKYIKEKNTIHRLLIVLATKKVVQDFSDALLKEIVQRKEDSLIGKLINISNQNQKILIEKAKQSEVKCSSVKKEGTDSIKKCSEPSMNNCKENPEGFAIYKCENIVLQDDDLDELIKIIEGTNTQEQKQ